MGAALHINHAVAYAQGLAHTNTDLGKIIQYNDIKNKQYLYGEQGGFCNGCEHHFMMQNFTVDHIIAKAHGGTDHISNLQLLCGSCNSIKGTKSHEELLVLLTDKGWIKRKKAAYPYIGLALLSSPKLRVAYIIIAG